ncbi:hypothetical protein KAR91_46565 [Candidatus Pacearchaeota archaeon]|nr:hypothetical protein [Candidatus Pacearchaeota archaeon]
MRDITLEDTFYIDFTTRAFATGIPTTLTGTPVLSVLEENNATPITAGVSVSVDRASVTGLNMATIVATAANGYENGKGYSLYISTGTVDSVSVVGEVVGQFTIGASAAAVDLANGTDGLTALKTAIDGVPTTAEFEARTILAASYFDPANDDVAVVTLVNTLTTYTGDTPQTADHTAGIADIPTVAEFNARTILAADYFDPTADAVANVTLVATTTTNTDMRGTDSAALASVATEARLAELDPANLPATTDDTNTVVTTTNISVDKIPKSDGTVTWNATALASINGECDTALTDYDGPTNAEMVARTLLASAYFDPTTDAVANVTLVATTTTNTDMRGTDSAFLAASAPSNFSSMVISVAGLTDANAQQINSVDVIGAGIAADLWRA